MSTKPKRKYGTVRPGAETSAGTNDTVFDKFISPATPAAPITLPSQTRQTTRSSLSRPAEPIAPARDFHKTANSIAREAIPAGLFKGQSKKLYDALYLLTRGAVVPCRSIRISRTKLMKKAAIGARVTFDAHLVHLHSVGLLEVRPIAGEHEGNEYTVYLPGERTLPSQSSQTTPSSPAQNLDRLDRLENSQTRQSVIADKATASALPQTSFKTSEQNIDDEATRRFVAILRKAERELTGKDSAFSDKWSELAELLVAELQIAAARTGAVSNVPAFLTEHLRRRLWKKDKAQLEQESREAPSEAESKQVIDANKCPDCGGANWFYPDGPEKGVAKCRHTKLQ